MNWRLWKWWNLTPVSVPRIDGNHQLRSKISFLEKTFQQTPFRFRERGTKKNFLKLNCKALTVPKLDQEVKEQLKWKSKDPFIGGEKSLYKIQEQLFDGTGSLMCLWSDLLNKEAKVSFEDTLLIQHTHVLLGSASHTASQERRKIVWSRINPQLKALATEEYDKRESNCIGPGFLEKANKMLKKEKALSIFTSQGRGGGPCLNSFRTTESTAAGKYNTSSRTAPTPSFRPQSITNAW